MLDQTRDRVDEIEGQSIYDLFGRDKADALPQACTVSPN